MKLPVKFYKHSSTIEDEGSKLIIDVSELSEKDADLVIRAVNNHDKLVEMLEYLLEKAKGLEIDKFGKIYSTFNFRQIEKLLDEVR